MITRRLFCGCLAGAIPFAAATAAHAQSAECAVFTPDRQKATAPDEAIARLKAGNERFTAGKSINCNLMAQVKETADNQSPYAAIEFRLTTSEIRNPDGSVVFRAEDVEVPASWSQVASDVLAQKYFRKAGVPARLKRVEEERVPSFLWRSVADEAALAALPEKERFGGETSAKQQGQKVLAFLCDGVVTRINHAGIRRSVCGRWRYFSTIRSRPSAARTSGTS